MFATPCAREAAGGRGPASAFPASPFSGAPSVWSSATSMRGTRFVCVCVCVKLCQVSQNSPKPIYDLPLNVFSDDGTELTVGRLGQSIQKLLSQSFPCSRK